MSSTNWIEGKWDEFKGEVRKVWGTLTDDDLEKTKGNLTSIGGLVQQKYGKAEDGVHDRITEMAKKFQKGTADATQAAKESLRPKN